MQDVIFLVLFIGDVIDARDTKWKNPFNESVLRVPTLVEELTDNFVDRPAKPHNVFRRFSVYGYYDDIEEHPESHTWWFENLMRGAYDENLDASTLYTDKVRACYTIIAAYTGAMQDLRRYFEIRYLYLNILEYEVGYMVHEIINKYQRMIELFGLVRKRYLYQIRKNRAPAIWMSYMYTNILELSKIIIHLCNMLYEVKFKYAGPSRSVFSDVKTNKSDTEIGESDAWDTYIKTYAAKKAREKELKAQKAKLTNKHMKFLTAWTMTPKTGPFPLHYGWSIEDW